MGLGWGTECSLAPLKRWFCSQGQLVGGGESLLPETPETRRHAPSSPCAQLLRQRREGEAAALRDLQKLQEDRRLLREHLGSLQGALAQLESEKREAERLSLRLEKEKGALRRTLEKVSHAAARGRTKVQFLNCRSGFQEESV